MAPTSDDPRQFRYVYSYEQVRKRMRHGTATAEMIGCYKRWMGKDAVVKQESPEQKKVRLEKQRARSAKRLRDETEEQANLRRKKARIRMKLKRSHRWELLSEEKYGSLCRELESLSSYPKHMPAGWWKGEKIVQWKKRCETERLRQEKIRFRKREERDSERFFARALWAMKSLKNIESRLNNPRSRCFMDEQDIKRKEGYGFKLDKELSMIESKLKLCFRDRKRPRWITTPPENGKNRFENAKNRHKKVLLPCFKENFCAKNARKEWSLGSPEKQRYEWRQRSLEKTDFIWHAEKGEWEPNFCELYVSGITENGYRLYFAPGTRQHERADKCIAMFGMPPDAVYYANAFDLAPITENC